MEINEEIFIRTNCGNIFKTNKEKIFVSNDLKTLYIQLNGINNHARYDITKHSKDIIDLILKKDIVVVKGSKYEVLEEAVNEKIVINKFLHYDEINRVAVADIIGIDEIEAILTHEQFEANAYKIEKEV